MFVLFDVTKTIQVPCSIGQRTLVFTRRRMQFWWMCVYFKGKTRGQPLQREWEADCVCVCWGYGGLFQFSTQSLEGSIREEVEGTKRTCWIVTMTVGQERPGSWKRKRDQFEFLTATDEWVSVVLTDLNTYTVCFYAKSLPKAKDQNQTCSRRSWPQPIPHSWGAVGPVTGSNMK